MSEALLSVRDLSVTFASPRGPVRAVRNLSLNLAPGEILALAGESGCGKSTAALAIPGLLAPGAERTAGAIRFDGRDISGFSERQLRTLRGREIAFVFQEPSAALNPVAKAGVQVAEVLTRHRGITQREARARTIALFARVRMTDPERRYDQYPHELSGGLKQRVVIAAAIAAGPRLLIADEPTTALDATVQSEILGLLRSLRDESGMSILLVSHDLALVSSFADRLAVLYAGRIVEEGPAVSLLRAPRPLYPGLLAARPGGAPARSRLRDPRRGP